MLKKKKRYSKPTIKLKKVKLNYFFRTDRFLDSTDFLINAPVFSQGLFSCETCAGCTTPTCTSGTCNYSSCATSCTTGTSTCWNTCY